MLARTQLSSSGLKMMKSQFTRPMAVSSLRRCITTLPQPAGGVIGTVNDAYIAPPASKTHGSLHWTTERLVSVGLVPLTFVPLVTGVEYGIADSILAALLLVHSHIGFGACIADYIPARTYGSLHNYAMYLLSFGGLVSAYGIYEIESREKEGLIGIIKKLWTA
ncbi:unnamed protein product [Kuraishia capsulata CBS 1993]|uniref:Succinate dehydrogenase [ubiquinone] cytochrome b small subunit n=1 Tax=Kuraishia capsulata CBS 1993 TaxID=1382522 RepID=W6MPN9_9ASCO|nr:uncharacterized protein KUCA_T00004285001 [Kuraishia capsulata CBS 1993]CDK28303.1 unnamed protein product [Kuraishia capsulata CBS 1993]